MINKVLILGGGSAGFLTAITLKRRLPQLAITVLRSPEIGIIGVGESSTPALPIHLHGYLEIDPAEFYREAKPSWKLGIHFLWGKRHHFNYSFNRQYDTRYQGLRLPTGYYCDADCNFVETSSALMDLGKVAVRMENGGPYIGSDLAYHIENETFVSYLERLAIRWGVDVKSTNVVSVERTNDQIHALLDETGARHEADLFVDCSGFRSYLLGHTLGEPFISFADSLYNDRAIVGGKERTDEPILPYTTAETMDCGWCWRIELPQRINRGYVYSSRFISDEDAEREFLTKNPWITDPTRVVRYVTGRRERAWVGNVVAIGNASGFVEPLESTALGVICGDAMGLAEALIDTDRDITPTVKREYNKRSAELWTVIRDFLAIHYKFNTRLDNEYWQTCRREIDLKTSQPIYEFYVENGPTPIWRKTLLSSGDIFDYEGYFSLFIGMQIPYARQPAITDAEWNHWKTIRTENEARAKNAGMTAEEALAVVTSNQWSWDPNFYRQLLRAARAR